LILSPIIIDGHLRIIQVACVHRVRRQTDRVDANHRKIARTHAALSLKLAVGHMMDTIAPLRWSSSLTPALTTFTCLGAALIGTGTNAVWTSSGSGLALGVTPSPASLIHLRNTFGFMPWEIATAKQETPSPRHCATNWAR